ncbi:MAG: [FeFe] hydrogenase H-cluster radical SAM maturase HydE [Kiritimatiellaeota bacterium]|nr:[FeFe] hydrogenase H-cluster radical SAM maturase HydE [Kiritimatiellota bacterium]
MMLNHSTDPIDPAKLTPCALTEVLSQAATDPAAFGALCAEADQIRARVFGDTVHIRGIIEFSNHCRNDCLYCGIRCSNSAITRYRMSADEILETALTAKRLGCGTVVLQSGEDPFFTAPVLSAIICRIKNETGLAVTLSVGVRTRGELAELKAAGCDRYLLRFETSSETLFNAIHPDCAFAERIACLQDLRELGYQVGSGFMIGLPDAPLEQIARDIAFTTQLNLQMIGCGPFLAHPGTPLAGKPTLEHRSVYYAAMALLRILNPHAHIPSTTAFDALDPDGRDRVMQCGANIFMPNITPAKYRRLYQLYPGKPSVDEGGDASFRRTCERLTALGRTVSTEAGHAF